MVLHGKHTLRREWERDWMIWMGEACSLQKKILIWFEIMVCFFFFLRDSCFCRGQKEKPTLFSISSIPPSSKMKSWRRGEEKIKEICVHESCVSDRTWLSLSFLEKGKKSKKGIFHLPNRTSKTHCFFLFFPFLLMVFIKVKKFSRGFVNHIFWWEGRNNYRNMKVTVKMIIQYSIL